MSEINKIGSMSFLNSLNDSQKISNSNKNSFSKENLTSTEKKNLEQQKMHEVADMYEQYFMKEMIKGMRSTVQESDFIKANHAEQIFREQLDDQYANEWNKKGGFGLADMIYQQLSKQLSNDFGKQIEKPTGPVAGDKIINIQKVDENYLVKSQNQTSDDVQNPWAGELQNKFKTEDEKTSIQIKHDNGLESTFLLNGPMSKELQKMEVGDSVLTGQRLGQIDHNSALVWKLKKSVSE